MDTLQTFLYFSFLAGIRRQIKPHRDSISFVGLLNEIVNNPEELSRRY